MSSKWEHAGPGDGIIGQTMQMLGMGGKECVRNTETDELKNVFVMPGQSVGDAISKGQFVDDED